MKVAQIYVYGGSEQIKIEDSPRPEPRSNQVLVKVYDAGVNPVDWKIREGSFVSDHPHFPMTLGLDFAGQIVELGGNVIDFNEGDRVFGFATGTYAEYAAAARDKIALMPESLDFVTAASLPTPGLTAWQLIEKAKIQEGQKILIHGAAGSVGSIAAQLALWKKAFVIGTASADDKEYLEKLGLQKVIDYKAQRFEDQVKDVDVVLDLVGGRTLSRSYQVMKKGGLAFSTVGAFKEEEAHKRRISGENFSMVQNAKDLAALVQLIDDGVVKVRISEIFPLFQARQAQDLTQKGHAHGKVIIGIA